MKPDNNDGEPMKTLRCLCAKVDIIATELLRLHERLNEIEVSIHAKN
jgi:hypothetical protein